jgi:hypothetical protein
MTETSDALRQCPTRVDGSAVLFAHKVSQGQCQDRQRGRYHKCFTCVHNNALAGRPVAAANPKLLLPAAAKSAPALPKLVRQGERLGQRVRVHAG